MDTLAALNTMRQALGDTQVDVDPRSCKIASRDYYWMSPILSAELGDRPYASGIVSPRNTDELSQALAIAYEHKTPLTPRGKGTGNYGQAVPYDGGIVLDLTNLNRIISIDQDWITAEVGCTFQQLEAAAAETMQELQIVPSTTKSTLGGFLGGGAGGAGSVQYGFLWNAFVASLEVLPCNAEPKPFQVTGEDCNDYLHAFGTTGVIIAAKVRLRPKRDWTALYFSFEADNLAGAAAAAKAFTKLPIIPRLNTIDLADAVALMPHHPGMPNGRISLRPMADKATTAECIQIVEQNGGRFELERPEDLETLHLLSYNHFTLRVKRKRPDFCHLQVAGDALLEKTDAIIALLPEATLHLECRLVLEKQSFGGLLVSRFVDQATMDDAIANLRQMGLMVVNVHSHKLGEGHLPKLENVLATKTRNDPRNLLNAGRIPNPSQPLATP